MPYPLRMDATGQLLPVEITQVFAPHDGQVRVIRAKPGDEKDPGFEVVELFSPDLAEKYMEVQSRLFLANQKAAQLHQSIKDLPLGMNFDQERSTYKQQLQDAETQARTEAGVLRVMERAYNMGKAPLPGRFFAILPEFDPDRARPPGQSKWTILNSDRRENLHGRTMRPSEELLRVGNVQGAWHAEVKIPQRNIGQVRRAFADPAYYKFEAGTNRKYLDVDVLLRSQSDRSYLGRLYEDGVAAQAIPNKNAQDESEPVVTAYVKLNLDGFTDEQRIPFEQFVTGLEVSVRIRCGDHSLGYSMFHGVWEWFYEKVVFFF